MLPIAGFQFALKCAVISRSQRYHGRVAGWRRMTASGIVMSTLHSTNRHLETEASGPKSAMNRLMRCNKNGAVSENRLSGVQLMEQRFGLLQIERVEALCEPLIDLGDRASRFVPLPLVAE
jgi:hypothetical protein